MLVKDVERDAETLRTGAVDDVMLLGGGEMPCGIHGVESLSAKAIAVGRFQSDDELAKPARISAADPVETDISEFQLHDGLSEHATADNGTITAQGPSAPSIEIATDQDVGTGNEVLDSASGRSPQSVVDDAVGDERLDSDVPAQSQMEPSLATEALAYTGTNVVSTPVHLNLALPRFVNTIVSKVPLRPEGYTSPAKISKKRSRSLSAGPSSTKKAIISTPTHIPRSQTVIALSPQCGPQPPSVELEAETPGQTSFAIDDFGDSTLDGIDIDDDNENQPPPPDLTTTIRSTNATPGERVPLQPMKGAAASGVLLQGAIVFVDVHTTEGADASGIFIELLTQMGAKCVRQWSWNPRAGLAADAEAEMINGRVGITHVVYKDGGKRSLEKVRDAAGVVKCVGVGWVLE